jgi:plastocyanin
MAKRYALLAASVVSIAVVAAVGTAIGSPDKIALPTGYEKWERYAIVDRHDTKQYRELYTSPEAVKAARAGRPVPDGTIIVMAISGAQVDDKGVPVRDANGRFMKDKLAGVTVMEKRKGWGSTVPEEWRNGDWQYAAFTADGKPNEKANAGIQACFVCHKPHEKQDFVISLAQLSGKFPTAAVASRSGAQDVNIKGFSFGPGTIKVAAGSPVTWTNTDDSPHQISVAGQPLRTAVLLKGDSASLSFADAGTFGYICGLHPGMKGSIEVTK